MSGRTARISIVFNTIFVTSYLDFMRSKTKVRFKSKPFIATLALLVSAVNTLGKEWRSHHYIRKEEILSAYSTNVLTPRVTVSSVLRMNAYVSCFPEDAISEFHECGTYLPAHTVLQIVCSTLTLPREEVKLLPRESHGSKSS